MAIQLTLLHRDAIPSEANRRVHVTHIANTKSRYNNLPKMIGQRRSLVGGRRIEQGGDKRKIMFSLFSSSRFLHSPFAIYDVNSWRLGHCNSVPSTVIRKISLLKEMQHRNLFLFTFSLVIPNGQFKNSMKPKC
ncbi:hypothetical protein VNO77_44522 [Canavalia gladiata]|uniref:Uncharacterized protein n=1 Tax=Canavalia gladiata TaxID=3824 RepID=A0AAN9PR41_CANGL